MFPSGFDIHPFFVCCSAPSRSPCFCSLPTVVVLKHHTHWAAAAVTWLTICLLKFTHWLLFSHPFHLTGTVPFASTNFWGFGDWGFLPFCVAFNSNQFSCFVLDCFVFVSWFKKNSTQITFAEEHLRRNRFAFCLWQVRVGELFINGNYALDLFDADKFHCSCIVAMYG